MEKLKTNTLRTLFAPFCRYLNNDLGSASVFNVKITRFVWSENWLKLKIRESFTAASKIKWLVTLRILEISCK